MSVVLSVYSKSGFKDFVLPAVNNAEIALLVEHHIFQLQEDVELNLEVIDGYWKFCNDLEQLSLNNRPYQNEALKNQDNLIFQTQHGERLAIVVQMKESSFSVYWKYDLTKIDNIFVGSREGKTIQYSHRYNGAQIVSQDHAKLHKSPAGWVLTDTSSNGTFINDIRINHEKMLEFGDRINIWGLRMVFLGAVLAVEAAKDTKIDTLSLLSWEGRVEEDPSNMYSPKMKTYYHRSPRNMEKLETERVEIEAPPSPKEENETPLLMLIGPSLTMMVPMLLGSGMAILSSRMSGTTGSSFMYTGLITAASSGLLGAFWAITNVHHAKKKARQDETKRFDAYGAYLMKCAEDVKKKYQKNTKILTERYPSAESVVDFGDGLPANLWGRNRSHEDFLFHRLGIGDMPFQVAIDIPKERFTMINDTLADKPQFIRDNYKILHQVPIGIDLIKTVLIGIVGGSEKAGAYQIVYDLVAQIVTQNCYTDVKLAFLSREAVQNGQDAWSFALWLPHVWSENKKNRYVGMNASESSDVLYDITQILRQRAEEAGSGSDNKKIFRPHYVLIVEDESLLEGELIEKYIYDQKENIGLTTILMAENYSDLPNFCECIIQNDTEYNGIYNVKTGRNNGISVQFDVMNAKTLERVARRLANVEVSEVEMGGEIPQSITFFDMYGVNSLRELNVIERWKKNRTYENMKALIGIKTGGQPCYLDLHEKYHGPHGLIAGTTGSGKSETLQTYILSLALNFSPDDIGFFVIDYKGGGMGNLFNGLPHVLGQISNLSGNQVRRAMVSIKSENLRRQRLFNENGVNNINAYTRLYKTGEAKIPIPHLLIIIDEFAELKREEEDFMRELISVAQVGRSLGVHLILATQKPNGTVDANIWSNSKFRLCLRVQDRQDSMEMLHKADAAYLTQAGRGYLQVGNDELYELFQSGWSGAIYDEETGNSKQEIAMMITNTGRTAITGNHLRSKRKQEAKVKWISCLLDMLKEACTVCQWEQQKNDADVLAEMYRTLKQNGIEYGESDYNTKLLRNLMTLYEEVMEKYNLEQNVSGACDYIIDVSTKRGMKLPEMKEKTQLDAIVEYLARLTEKLGYQKQQPLWLPVLKEKIFLQQLEGFKEMSFLNGTWPVQGNRWELKALVGMCDDPANQFQMPLELNFAEDGNHAVCGISMSGKSTFLQTVVYSLIQSYSPEYLNLYILDFSSRMLEPFERAPHVGGILYENDLATVGKFFRMIQNMLQERKALFRGGNYYQYVAKNKVVCPVIVIVIDNMAVFREKTEEAYDEVLLQLSRECTANGIYLLLSGAGYSLKEIPSRLGDNIRRTICLEMQDKFEYADALNTMQISVLPESGVAGRGLAVVDGNTLEFQTCLALESMDDYGRIEAIRTECERMNELWTGKAARPIPQIPEKPVWSEFLKLDSLKAQMAAPTLLPYGYELATADVIGVDLRRTYCYLISGKTRTGKTNLLRIMMRVAAGKGAHVIVVEFESEELRAEAEMVNGQYIQTAEEYMAFMQNIIPIYLERQKLKKELQAQALEDDEIFIKMSKEAPYFIFLADLVDYSKMMHGPEGKAYNFKGSMANLLEKGNMLNIYYFAAFNWDKRMGAIGQEVYENFIKYKTGVHLGGYADSQSILEFQGISYRDLSAADKAGCGIAASVDGAPASHVVTPLARG